MEHFGSEGWLQATRAAAEALPEVPGCSLTARVEVSGGPDGPCRLGVVIRDGRLVELSPGRPAEMDCTVSCSNADARAILNGQLDPAVAYMQGRLKLEGAYERVVFGLRGVVEGEAFTAFAASVMVISDRDCS